MKICASRKGLHGLERPAPRGGGLAEAGLRVEAEELVGEPRRRRGEHPAAHAVEDLADNRASSRSDGKSK